MSQGRATRLGYSGSDGFPEFKWPTALTTIWVTLPSIFPPAATNPNLLANIGIGHGAIDLGAGFTELDDRHSYNFIEGREP
ncbi:MULTISPECIES: hypothetical protein [Bradyrhizobium]|jgi:hypothetical protein|uniref:hypothetical protein n=1 Tax=Bradyrhizobium TaxID=374 RepID=UPI0004BC187C|nr:MULTISPECIES: hypothetical protein [Bradyrhizobium]MCP1971764.1 hypothetical protein [Bradyrhizobium elkanii]MCS3451978.1 hypothetical protein [Bradyrhizobium elkanii]MCS3518913.1 hypothetical protein [Bradyrhizobium elkanii]MCS3565923.1 hypothetical protein [Bradyrhizobium elkanii]MCS4075471.1 hypothetical protein [Bradyrhizobium elkanii]